MAPQTACVMGIVGASTVESLVMGIKLAHMRKCAMATTAAPVGVLS
jgi:hypothetical protein